MAFLALIKYKTVALDKTRALLKNPQENNNLPFSVGCSRFVWANMVGADKTAFPHPLGNPLRSGQLNGSVHAISDLNKFNADIRDKQLIFSASCFFLKSVAYRLIDSDCEFPHSQLLCTQLPLGCMQWG